MSVGASRATATSAKFGGRVSPPPGLDAFPEMATATPTGDGDDLLDALLGLNVADPSGRSRPVEAASAGGADETLSDFTHTGLDGTPKMSFSEVTAAAAGDGAFGKQGAVEDSMLDALLGLDVGGVSSAGDDGAVPGESVIDGVISGKSFPGEDVTGEQVDAYCAEVSDVVVVGGSADVSGTRGEEGGDNGIAGTVGSPPFDGAELRRLCRHLNDRNRRAKRLAQRCQDMFLSMFFKVRSVPGRLKLSTASWLLEQ